MPRKRLSIIAPKTKPFTTLGKIRKHNYSETRFRVIANGVFDRLPEAEGKNISNFHLDHPQTPYADRNLGEKQVRDGIISFLD